ncbi:MAG TPA: D-glycero-beta-D-manno-heptose 1-phosphate adenylyltransferase [Candidatus Ozemobacteraceae bacterium]|nr:D-glycero-beta-D-manno-heptose 1-phosphate adenylyltransferase [Candidatus Ozemobacteraceae bacterium]
MNPVDAFWNEDLAALRRTLGSIRPALGETFGTAAALLCDALRQGRQVLVCGNGGSASDAEHMVGELTGRFLYDRPPLAAVALTCGSAAITAIGNDYGYEEIFRRQVLALGRPGDILIGISTSGGSKNVLRAVEAAREKSMKVIALTGPADSKLSAAADVTLRSPSPETPRIQEIHAILIHSLCRAVEATLFPERAKPALPDRQILEGEAIDLLAAAAPAVKLNMVFTNGCFDILHPGHVSLLQACRAEGDLLVVGLNSDASVRRLKGPTRPFHPFAERAAVLAALSCVDYVIGFDEDTPLELITRLVPKVLVKGGDYTRETIVGADVVEKAGGRVVVFPLVEGHSTTRILNSHGH